MNKAIIFLVAGALIGGVAGNFIALRRAAPHRHPRAVMTLLGFHHDRLEAAVKAANCRDFETESTTLRSLQPEIALALPVTYRDEAGFRKSDHALADALQPAICAASKDQFKHVTDACDECHKVYDPD